MNNKKVLIYPYDADYEIFLEQILCFNSSLDTETFCTQKSAIFIVLPEEDTTKYFMVSLFLQQGYCVRGYV